MKRPLKQQENSAASVQAGSSQPTNDQLPADLPFVGHHARTTYLASSPLRSPEAESFRAFLKSRLPREKASPALLSKIRQITKSPA